MSGHSSMSEKARFDALQKQREKNRAEIAQAKDDLLAESQRDRTSANRFVGKTDSVEDSLKLQTMGLQRLEDFTAKKRALEEQRQREAAQTADLEKEERKKKKNLKKDKKAKLSFAQDDEEEVKEERPSKRAKLGKNPAVDTTFLPDRDREEAERKTREELRQEWLRRQEEIKGETINVVFSYWDGSGHRQDVDCKKGDTIAQFLEKAKTLFPEIRGVSVDNLMYIKEDLIIPHHHTFYDFIVSKARGKSGPLFNFDVHEDVRLIHDARIEKDESHAGKVCERIWYTHNMHIFPASRWETYQVDKEYGKQGYTIRDKKEQA